MLAALSACSTTLPGDNGGGDGGATAEDLSPPLPRDMGFDPDAFWAQDPPPAMCTLDGSMLPLPPPPGGTPDCPDDKNRQGCACPKVGTTAACWPGLRANRSLGICQDGLTTCTMNGEFGAVWGPCQGYVLPVPGATGGADACKCFSKGRWALENTSPCFYTGGDGTDIGAASTVIVSGKAECAKLSGSTLEKPTQPWSPNTLKVDCVGRWKLCYTLKAGDYKNPQPTDCTMVTVCTEGDYAKSGEEQAMPVLPSWMTSTPAQVACAAQFKKTGGYGEMSVDGSTVSCDKVQKVFNRVGYCPLSCNANPTAPECKNCMNGGSGEF